MVPIRLRLENFLSYGTAAEALDFGQFEVACLSGGNGQGKSALLDAVTWALWGEARKTAGGGKPDDDLLRIGARRMEVDLEFEVEDQRYRVVRSYQKSASGKTSKPGLELQAMDPETGGYQPLTAPSIRETQAEIDRRIGLDYHTFVNSAFLLQGRSDEFTKKRPGERKEILAKILALDRYDRLASRASERGLDAKSRLERAQTELDRLEQALEPEPTWRGEHAATQERLAESARHIAAAREREAAAADQLATLDAVQAAAQAARDRQRRHAAAAQRAQKETADLAARISEAESLLGQREQIEARHDRYEGLRAERESLDQKADLRRGLDQQLFTLKGEVERKRLDLDRRLGRLEADLQADRKALTDAERKLAERPRTEQALTRAREAETARARLQKAYEEKRQLEQRRDILSRQIEGAVATLKGQIETRKAALREQAGRAVDLGALRAEWKRLHAAAQPEETLAQAVEEIHGEGQTLKGDIEAAKARADGFEQQAAEAEAKARKVRETDADECPTCGTHLTDEHRAAVESTYAGEARRHRERAAEARASVPGLLAHRETLGERYRETKRQLDAAREARAEAEQVRQRAESVKAEQSRSEAEQRAVAELEEQLAEGRVEPDKQAKLTQAEDALRAVDFDEAAYDQARSEAAQLDRWTSAVRELDELAERAATLHRRSEQQQKEAAALREDLASGASVRPLQDRVDVVARQLASVGYDGERHEAVRRELASLAEAPKQLARMLEAGRSLSDWTARRDRVQQDAREESAEAQKADREATEAEARLAARADAERVRAEAAAERATWEGQAADLQSRLGALAERLEQCARDRKAQQAWRDEHQQAKIDRTLYAHLRKAFGRDGIPSLIIEETLPEIEERANTLLGRLTNGRTSVRLDTLRDKKSGGTKETLDIHIADEQGVARPYETFSGGEAFRVNFALRLALAQLLAERAGVRVRTLVIDEGFGTQDEQGIQALIEAIDSVKDDFDKVLVITHLDEMKAAFPVRIEVTKDPVDGSSFEVLGV